jgi:hypothetical protein
MTMFDIRGAATAPLSAYTFLCHQLSHHICKNKKISKAIYFKGQSHEYVGEKSHGIATGF